MEETQPEGTAFDWKEFSQRTWVVVVSGLVFPPLGIFLSWRKTDWAPKAKWIATGLMGLLLLWRMGGSEKKERPEAGKVAEAAVEVEKTDASRNKAGPKKSAEEDQRAYESIPPVERLKKGYLAPYNAKVMDGIRVPIEDLSPWRAALTPDGEQKGKFGNLVTAFMESPSWKAGESADGDVLVNVSGFVQKKDKKVRATIQFVLEDDVGFRDFEGRQPTENYKYGPIKVFRFQALDFNGVPQSMGVAGQLFTSMLKSVLRLELP